MEHEVDGWIQQLSQCKQLTEADVKKLCDKVRSLPSPTITARLLLGLFSSPRLMSSDKRDIDGGVKRAARKVSCHRLR